MCLPLLGILGSLAGAAISGMGSMMAANEQAQGLKDQAKMNDRQAAIESSKAGFEAQQQRKKTDLALSNQQVVGSASGFDPNSGTNLEVQRDMTREGRLAEAAIQFGGQEAQTKLTTQAQVQRREAGAHKRAGVFNAIGGVFSAFSDIGSAFS